MSILFYIIWKIHIKLNYILNIATAVYTIFNISHFSFLKKFENEVISEEDKTRYLSSIEKIINYDALYIKEYIEK